MNKVTTRTVVTFHIDSHAKIEFILPSENLNAITCFEGAAIILYLNDQTYNLNNGISAFDDIRHDLDVIIEKIGAAIAQKLILPESQALLLGKLYAHATFFTLAKVKARALGVTYDESGISVAKKHMLWFKDVALYVFNGQDGSIRLIIAPSYRSHDFFDPDEAEDQIDFSYYHQYLKQYHVIDQKRLTKRLAQKWVSQAQRLLKIIECNVLRLIHDKAIE
ncbi:hypothetical protein IPH25_01275 [bacterium]|nr:MAG: hypothetical protein IPG37_03400 [bacterium]QQR62058.1 MAG: hypothetical protein IPH25_01275 [bacterium]QQR62348.1 MAG: hypothetical protein IPH67_02860 [bacterium]